MVNGVIESTGRKAFGFPLWPKHQLDGPQEFVCDANVTSFVAADTYREVGIELINAAAAAVYGR